LSTSDEYLIGISYTISSSGFDMLYTLVNKLPGLMPMQSCSKSKNGIAESAYLAKGLESTIGAVFLSVVRISSLEAPKGATTPSRRKSGVEIFVVRRVPKMTETLREFYSPATQVQTPSSVCRAHLANNQEQVLLPKRLDLNWAQL